MPDITEISSRRHESLRVHNNSHGFRGVEWDRSRQKYRARIEATPGKRGKWLGRFDTPEAAAHAYDEAAREIYGDDARLNFPFLTERPTKSSNLQQGYCPEGHSLKDYGRVNARGSLYCTECNRSAARRYYARKKKRAAAELMTGK